MNNNENNINESYVEIGGDYLVKIINQKDISSISKRFGYDNNVLEIRYNEFDNTLISMFCMLCDWLQEDDLNLPDFKELKEVDNTLFLRKDRCDFRIIYNEDNLNIIFGGVNNISQYSKKGRINYYFDDEMKLCVARVNDLSKEEYNVLHDEEYEIGNYMRVAETQFKNR